MKKYQFAALVFAVSCFQASALAQQAPNLLNYVPSQALVAAIAEQGSYEQVQEFLKGVPEMRKDLSLFLTQKLGVDLTQVNGMAAWATSLGPRSVGAVFLRVPTKSAVPSSKPLAVVEGIKLVQSGDLVTASVPGGVLLGNEAGVRLAATLTSKKNEKNSLAAKGELAGLLKVKEKGDFVVAAASSLIDDAEFRSMIQAYGIQQLVFTVNQKQLRFEAAGNAQQLDQARSMLEGIVAMWLQKLRLERDKAMAKNSNVQLGQGVGAIFGYHQAKKIWEEIRPQLVGDRLVSVYNIPDMEKMSGAWAAWAGVVSGIAIPTFIGYKRSAQVAGAKSGMQTLWTSINTWAFEQDLSSPKFSFPKSTAWTPAKICCDGKQVCESTAKDWAHPTWKALNFQQIGKQRFQYRFTSKGTGTNATFSVEARGDLDCDGQLSSFKRSGRVKDGGIRGDELIIANEKE